MVIESIATGQQQTRDSVGSNPDIIPIALIKSTPFKTYSEPSINYDRNIDNSWIVGSSTNGLVGANTATVGGGQQVVGGTTNTQTLLRVKSKGNKYYNFLRDTPTNQYDDVVDYGLVFAVAGGAADVFLLQTGDTLLLQAGDSALLQSTAAGAAGSIDTTNFRIDMNASDTITWRLSYNDGTISSVKVLFDTSTERTNMTFDLSAGGSSPVLPTNFPMVFSGSGGVTIEVSADGGNNWQTVANGVETTITNTGSDLRMRLTANESGQYWKTADNNGNEVPIIVQFS